MTAEDLAMVKLRLLQILTPGPDVLSAEWHAADALYYLTGDEQFAKHADRLANEPRRTS